MVVDCTIVHIVGTHHSSKILHPWLCMYVCSAWPFLAHPTYGTLAISVLLRPLLVHHWSATAWEELRRSRDFLSMPARTHNTRESLMTFILYSQMYEVVWSHHVARTPQKLFPHGCIASLDWFCWQKMASSKAKRKSDDHEFPQRRGTVSDMIDRHYHIMNTAWTTTWVCLWSFEQTHSGLIASLS
jgi:hypothetical protein